MRAPFPLPRHLFREERPLANAAMIFILTTLFYYLGAMMRLVEELSLFWPLNAVMAGVFARYAFLRRWHYYLISYVAMLLYDAITTSWGGASLIINFSNMVFIITLAQLIGRARRQMRKPPQPVNALHLFSYCLFSAPLHFSLRKMLPFVAVVVSIVQKNAAETAPPMTIPLSRRRLARPSWRSVKHSAN